ncbi:hypothetical protein JCM33374_g6068 [Metschnikowia sp. JCM 33374]|nr:hypothetical protein JCM33374_g6068 [Metschnikowia sp. JCM 33374]
MSSEKDKSPHIEAIESSGAPTSEKFCHIDEKKLVRKIDLHLLPLFIVLYLLSFLDRGNIGNAKIEGLDKDLNLTGNQYNLCLMVFFLFYAAMEVPSNMILKRSRPNVYIPLTVVLFAVVMTCMGTVQNFGQLFATRALLGVFESALFPGISYMLSRYYKKNELLVRQSIFFSAASMAGAFSGLLAAAISKMHGVGGYEGWRWIFILEGLVTFIAGVVAFYLFPLFPASASFLTEEERQFVVERVQCSSNLDGWAYRRGGDSEKVVLGEDNRNDKSQILAVLKDWQCWFQMLSYVGILLPLYAISLFTPTIIKTLGYSSTRTQLMSVPIYIVAAVCAILQGLHPTTLGCGLRF